ncbi:MAG: AI-2E family transporter [Eubacteriales bacterium]
MLKFDNKNKFYFGIRILAISFIIVLIIINIDPLSGFFSSVLSVLTPIIFGAALAYILNPLLKLFELRVFRKIKNKRRVRTLSMILTYIIALALLVAVVAMFIPQLFKSVIDFSVKFDSYVAATTDFINNIISKFSDNSEYFHSDTLKNTIFTFFTKSENIVNAIAEYIKAHGADFVNTIKNIFLGLFISIYMLASKEKLGAQIRRAGRAVLSAKAFAVCSKYTNKTNATFGKFFIGKILDSVIIGIITLIALALFRIPYALLVSVIVGVTNIIPVFGPFIGAIPSALIIFIASPKKALIFIILILVIQQIDGNVIGPKILGNSTGISSLGVIIAIIVMSAYFGIVGMIIGVPIFAVISSVIEELVNTKLRKKQLSTDVADYYANPEFAHEEKHKTVSSKIFDFFGKAFKSVKSSHGHSAHKTVNEDTTDTVADEEGSVPSDTPEKEDTGNADNVSDTSDAGSEETTKK